MTVRADGTFDGSDGCRRDGGRWALGHNGRVLAVGYLQPADLPAWMAACPPAARGSGVLTGTARAGTDGRVVVLVDPSGRVTERLVRR